MKIKNTLIPFLFVTVATGFLITGCSDNHSPSPSPSVLKMELFGARGGSLTALTEGTSCALGERVVWESEGNFYYGHSIVDPSPTSAISATVVCGHSSFSQNLAPQAVFSGHSVFAIINPDQTVTLWGSKRLGGDSSILPSQPRNVTAVSMNERASAILQSDGTLITLGRASSGGSHAGPDEFSKPSLPLKSVTHLWPLNRGFLAQNDDGSVSAWGNLSTDGDIAPIAKLLANAAESLQNVKTVAFNKRAVAVLRHDKSVLTFGDSDLGGDSQSVADKLVNVVDLAATNFNMAALKADGSIVIWGENRESGDAYTGNESMPRHVVSLTNNFDVLSTLNANGTVSIFGDPIVGRGADINNVEASLQSQVVRLHANQIAFAALKKDGSVVTWGEQFRNDTSAIQDKLTRVKSIAKTSMAFAALHRDGTVTTWGDETRGGDSSLVKDQLINVVTIYSNDYAFAAIKKDGSVVSWGAADHGGDSARVAGQLNNIRAIYSTALGGFLAVSKEGRVISWGSRSAGGVLPAINLYVPFFAPLLNS